MPLLREALRTPVAYAGVASRRTHADRERGPREAGLPSDGATVIDATDRIVLPGLVDAHRHVRQSALRGADVGTDLSGCFRVLAQCGPRFRPHDAYRDADDSPLTAATSARPSPTPISPPTPKCGAATRRWPRPCRI
ncbi:hypothetical protein PV333_00970 [Streptomyces sp. NY05-11A]|nr:hypothetical protein [Streptomyces sp. NY05-11A]MDX2675041.1 hypothetical protein [Streptomyces sp. NY05-11A]